MGVMHEEKKRAEARRSIIQPEKREGENSLYISVFKHLHQMRMTWVTGVMKFLKKNPSILCRSVSYPRLMRPFK